MLCDLNAGGPGKSCNQCSELVYAAAHDHIWNVSKVAGVVDDQNACVPKFLGERSKPWCVHRNFVTPLFEASSPIPRIHFGARWLGKIAVEN